VKNVVDDATGSHKTWVHSSANDATERIPCGGIKPVPEFLSHPACKYIREMRQSTGPHVEALGRKHPCCAA
jgi:hypothetical protein